MESWEFCKVYLYEEILNDKGRGFSLIKINGLVASNIYLSCMLAANCSVVISNKLTGLSRGCIFAHTFGVAITVIDRNELKLYEYNHDVAQTEEEINMRWKEINMSFKIPPLI